MTTTEKSEQLSEEFDRTFKCQTCEENDTTFDYGMCPQMVHDSVKFHIEEILSLLNRIETKEDIEKEKAFYSECLKSIII